ncbi:Activating transcription factor 7-interacting protein 1 [Picochlorum sp. SENEW3]|nr:Activating transcription factor 7-interacting protein 1 [Picochlorum sp. SENEW3]
MRQIGRKHSGAIHPYMVLRFEQYGTAKTEHSVKTVWSESDGLDVIWTSTYSTSKSMRAADMERAALCTVNSAPVLDGGAGDGCSGDGGAGDGCSGDGGAGDGCSGDGGAGDGCSGDGGAGDGCSGDGGAGDGGAGDGGSGESFFTSPFQFVHILHSKSTFLAFLPYKEHPDPNRDPVH